MAKSALARVDEVEESPRPFALRFAERVSPLRLVKKPGSEEVFDDPTTVDWTSQQSPEDPHTDV